MKRSPLKRRSPLKAKTPLKRGGPIKAKRKPAKPKAEAAHLARVAGMACLVCGARPVHVHHVTSDGMKRTERSDRLVVPRCAFHHLASHGPHDSIHGIGPEAFNTRYGIDLLAQARELWGGATQG